MSAVVKLVLGLVLIGSLLSLSAGPVTFFRGGNVCDAGAGKGYCSAENSAVTVTFDDLLGKTDSPYATGNTTFVWGTPIPIVQGSVDGQYAAPPDAVDPLKRDLTPYLTVGSPSLTGTVTINAASPVYYFGFWMGSPDDYNHVEFFRNGDSLGSFIGSNLVPPGQGNQAVGDFVNFRIAGGADQVVLSSSQAAFEIDNVATSAVPEPATFGTLGTVCLALLGALRSKFRRS